MPFTNHLSLKDLMEIFATPPPQLAQTSKKTTVTESESRPRQEAKPKQSARVTFVSGGPNESVFEVELPGFGKEDVRVTASKDGSKALNIQASRKLAIGEVRKSARIELHRFADINSTTASIKNGMLTIVISNVKPTPGPKEIAVN